MMLCSSEHIRLNTDLRDQVRSSVFCQVTAFTSDLPCAELSQAVCNHYVGLSTDPGDQVRSSVFCQVTASTTDSVFDDVV